MDDDRPIGLSATAYAEIVQRYDLDIRCALPDLLDAILCAMPDLSAAAGA